MLALIAGVVLVAIAQLRFGAGHQADFAVVGAGAATVTPSVSAPATSSERSGFSISGSVSGLYPGASLPLVLTVSNPHAFAIDVTSVTTSVGTPNAGCASSKLTVTPFAGNLVVADHATATLTVTATLSHDAPDACQGVVFPLQYSGTAVKP